MNTTDIFVHFAFGFLALGLMVLLYFAPTIIASRKRHPNLEGIMLINVLTGWTMIGWLIAAAWACTNRPRDEHETNAV